jgi:hypothetical protein
VPRSEKFIQEKYKKKDSKGLYRITRRKNKVYLKDDVGEPMINIWNDILSFNYAKVASSESVFYPTQKPEGLLERIIMASSNPGDIVLDSFVGSGTSVAVAEKLNRRWIGCDINKNAILTTSKRIQRIQRDVRSGSLKEKGDVRLNSRFLIYINANISEKKHQNFGKDYFECELELNNQILSVWLRRIENKRILDNVKDSKNLSRPTRKALVQLSKTQLEDNDSVMLDSIYFDLQKTENTIYNVKFSDVPVKKHEKTSELYKFDLSDCLSEGDYVLKIKIIDKFANEYQKSINFTM